ncbi:Glutamyl-tRNA(Gln) amidotransferase subunit A [archaeon HR06]|nr:Glutamyl-tRNA(Gln) amidotransferase subunit A [archaeon HR06]
MVKIISLPYFEVRRKLLEGEIKMLEYLQETLERIEERKEINAFITLNNEAFKEAERLERKLKGKEKVGKLFGALIAVKDNISTKGIKTTCASKILYNYIPPFDATVIDKIKKEDGIILGKTNMDEFGMGSTTELSFFGPTLNPLDKSRVAGGSSGGSGAALVDYQANLALGADTGGSIRCPASFCGILGLKPTYGLVSRYGLISYANSLEQIGPMARCVKDLALLLEVIAGYDPRDNTTLKEEILLNNRIVKRAAIIKELVGEGLEKGVRNEFYKALEIFKDMKIEIDEVSLEILDFALPCYYIIAMAEASSNLARYDGIRYGLRIKETSENFFSYIERLRGEGFGEEVKKRIILGTFILSAGYYEQFYLKAQRIRKLMRLEFERLFKSYDLIFSPTMPSIAYKVGEKIKNPLEMYLGDVETVVANLVGIPALSIPCGYSNGMPVGLQIMGKPLNEATLLSIAQEFELYKGDKFAKY